MSFRSYISVTAENGETRLGETGFEEPDSCLKAPLLPGEIIVAEGQNVLKFDSFSDQKRGTSGSLFCTNFKISFATTDPVSQSAGWQLKNLLLDVNDICLSNIEAVYLGSGLKRKKLSPGSSCLGKVKTLEIHCKNFKVHTFSFKFSPVGHGKSVVNAILHHAFPPKLKLLFAFEYKTPIMKKRGAVMRYNKWSEWSEELQRTQCPGWRVTQVNEAFRVCDSLPEAFVVPSIQIDAQLIRAAPHFTGYRLLKWCWGDKMGNSLIRMASLDPAIIESKQIQVTTETVQRCHPLQKMPRSFSVDDLLPTYRDVQAGYLKLKSFCIADSAADFWEQDTNFKSGIESSKWLSNVASCLRLAKDAASTILIEKTSVILLESDDRDMNCVVSSLVQLILDPQCRTVQGFQSLIQKEWVAFGHRFADRLNLVRGGEQEESPVFLLFLDCVWQLIQQFPTVFEFTETYLIVLWDSTKIVLFDTFLFNSPKQRFDALYYADGNENVRLNSVWDWTLQYSADDTELFINPLYVVSYEIHNETRRNIAIEKKHPKNERLLRTQRDRLVISKVLAWSEDNLIEVKTDVCDVELWELCYFRWLPFCQVNDGGSPSMSFGQLRLASDALSSLKQIRELRKVLASPDRNVAELNFLFKKSLSKFKSRNGVVCSAFPFSSDVATDHRSGYSMPVLLPQPIFSGSDEDLSNVE
ncbi:MTMR12 (predicted) [Pycnogonum litorale]